MNAWIAVPLWRHRLQGMFLLLTLVSAAPLALSAHAGLPRAHAAGNCDVDTGKLTMDAEEQAFFNALNRYRTSMGAPALAFSSTLMQVALWKSTDMATHGYFDHTDQPLGRSFSQRMADCGYDPTAYSGEDLAACEPGGLTNLTQLQNQPEHNRSILDPGYLYAGVKRAQGLPQPGIDGPCWYWALDLGSVPGGATAAPAGPLAAPQLTAAARDGQTIVLQWTAVPGALGYQAYDGTDQSYLDPIAGNVTTLTVSGLSPGVYFCFVLNAYTATSTSGWSGWACAYTAGG